MKSNKVYLIKFYVYYLDTNECIIYEFAGPMLYNWIYELNEDNHYIELHLVDNGNSIEYVERSNTNVTVYHEIPKHWMLRVLSAVEDE